MPWTNNDGLLVRFDQEKIADTNPRGEAPGAGETRTIDVILDMTDTTAGAHYIIPGVIIPRNSFVQSIASTVVEAFSGATDLDLGLTSFDGGEYDYDGFITTMAAVTAGAEAQYVKGGTGAGVLVGTELAYPGYLTVTPTGQATTGKVSLRVHVFVADEDKNPNNWLA